MTEEVVQPEQKQEGKIEEEVKPQPAEAKKTEQKQQAKDENQEKLQKIGQFVLKYFILGSLLYLTQKFIHRGYPKSGWLLRPKFWLTSLNLMAFVATGDLSVQLLSKVEAVMNLKKEMPYAYAAIYGPTHLILNTIATFPIHLIFFRYNGIFRPIAIGFFNWAIRSVVDAFGYAYAEQNFYTGKEIPDLIVKQEVCGVCAFLAAIFAFPLQKIFWGESFDVCRARGVGAALDMNILTVWGAVVAKYLKF